jgi:hypothetical protein
MRAQVVEHARARQILLAPALLAHLRAEAVEVRLVAVHRSEQAAAQDLAHGEEVVVPAAVMEHGQHLPARRGQARQLLALGGVDDEGLVHHHVLAREQRLLREREVRLVRRGDHHQVDLRRRQQRLRVRHHLRLRQVALHLGRVAGRHVRQPQAFHGADQRRVEHLSGEAVAHQAHVHDPHRDLSCSARPRGWRLKDERASLRESDVMRVGSSRPGAARQRAQPRRSAKTPTAARPGSRRRSS